MLGFFRKRTIFGAALMVLVAMPMLGKVEASTPTKSAPGPKYMIYAGNGNSSGWVPIEIYQGHIYLSAKVNGREVPALLDSGASVIVVNAPDGPGLGINASGSETGHGLQGSATSGMAQAVSVAIGNLTVKSDRVAMPDLTRIVQQLHRPLAVVIGGEFFRDAIVDIDFARKRLEFRKPSALKVSKTDQVVPLHEEDGLRVASVQIEGRPAEMTFDLGNGGSMNLRAKFWGTHSFMNNRPSTPTDAEGYAGVAKGRKVEVRTLRIGKTTLFNVTAMLLNEAGPSSVSDGNIGLPIWSQFHLVIDFPRNRIFLSM